MNTDFDVAIIGGGIIGASIFYHLSRNHYRVALVEKNEIASGCTKSSGGIIRSFHIDNDWAEKSLYGWKYYREFESNTGVHSDVNQCGFLYIPVDANILRAQKQVDHLSKYIAIKCLTTSEIEQQFGYLFAQIPQFAVFEPLAMYISPVNAANAWVKAAIHYNGMLYEHTHVKTITLTPSAVLIETQQGCISAKQVVIAAGSNTPTILDQLGFHHHLYVKQIRADIRKPAQCASMYPAFVDERNDLYGRPDFVSGSMHIGLPTIQDNADDNHTNDIYCHGSKRFKWVEKSHLSGSVYSDDCYSFDGRPNISALNKEYTVFIASGFSGSGVKLAPWAGAEMLRLVNNTRGE